MPTAHSSFRRSLTGRLRMGPIVAAVLAGVACSDSAVTAPQAFDPPGTHRSTLTALGGTGTGGVSVTPVAVPQGYFTADIKLRMHGGKPNTVYIVQRAPEIGRAMSSDGVCQRALGLAPWSPSDAPAPAFVTFAKSDGTPFTITTSASGDGSLDFNFVAAMIPTGTHFDVMFRALDDLAAPTSVFLSGCFTVAVL